MRQIITKWIFRLTITLVFIITLLLIILLNPVLTYANKTTHNNYTIFHDKAVGQAFYKQLDRATELLTKSEFYNEKLKLEICLNDGSYYPVLMQKIRGQAFAWGFYNKVVLQGLADYDNNYVEVNGYKWNLAQLLAHELTHCLQFNKLGIWKSDPLGGIPAWKNEGYPEYIARQSADQTNLRANIERFNKAEINDRAEWGISFTDSTFVGKNYYGWWMLMQYCMDIKRLTYQQVLKDTTSEETLKTEMMNWYNFTKK